MRVGSVPEAILNAFWFGERSRPGFIPLISRKDHYGGPGVLVWGGIMLYGRTELHIFGRGSVTGDRYCEEDALGRRIAARLYHPENTQQLKQRLIEEWALLPQEMLHQLVLSIRRRCEATIAVRGGHIPY
ncbi:transposable element Tcb2 transposase [Trichonephila clavipes]|nr:transposable element Tcb2 transposase [Trichonephila clavipes]